MGNNVQKQNAEFGKNFNFAEHNRKMQQNRHNYQNHDLYVQKQGHQVHSKQQSYTELSRQHAIFKPSISIAFINGQIRVKFEYDSVSGCELHVFIGINNIQEDGQKKTTQITSDFSFHEHLCQGKKVKFSKEYYLSNIDRLQNKQIILRIQKQNEATQYSLRKTNKKQQHWKIILQKLQKGNISYQLENIYGSGQEGQQCIICMCQPSNTLVKPCNHLCLCQDCSKTMSKKINNCPICRKAIEQLITISNKK